MIYFNSRILNILFFAIFILLDFIISFVLFYNYNSNKINELYNTQYYVYKNKNYLYSKSDNKLIVKTSYKDNFKIKCDIKKIYLYKNIYDYKKNIKYVEVFFIDKVEYIPHYKEIKGNTLPKIIQNNYKVYNFSDKYYLIEKNNLYGLCDYEGNIKLPLKKQHIYKIYNDIIAGNDIYDLNLNKKNRYWIRNILDTDLSIAIAYDRRNMCYIGRNPKNKFDFKNIDIISPFYNGKTKALKKYSEIGDYNSDNTYVVLIDRENNILAKSNTQIFLLENGNWLIKKSGGNGAIIKFFNQCFSIFVR